MEEFDENVAGEELRSIEDEEFDQIYPARLRKLSSLQWTPVRIATEAAKFLVTAPRTRVLDIGCGPGKFCLVAAALHDAQFTGVEQRADLAAAARDAATALQLPNVEIIHGNIVDLAFAAYDAFYLFNPFDENMFRGHRIDSAVPLSAELFERDVRHVAVQLGATVRRRFSMTTSSFGSRTANTIQRLTALPLASRAAIAAPPAGSSPGATPNEHA